MSISRALTRSRAFTRPDSDDPRLLGRDYPVPFGDVWRAALAVAERSPRWTIVETIPKEGRIHAEARTRLWKFVDDVEIRVSLDGVGLTRVDLTSASRVGSADLGTNARRIHRFLRQLDARLGVA